MIYVKVDVCLDSHPKFCAAGPAAVGYWTAALTYSYRQGLDGRVPAGALGLLLGVGPRKGRTLCERLVSVGLFERVGDDFAICKFAEKNATKQEVEARKRDAAGRAATFRKGRAQPEAVETTEQQAAADASRNALLTTNGGRRVLNSNSNSLSTSNSQSGDPGSLGALAGAATPVRQSVIAPDLRLNPDARASAEALGVRDIEGEWVKFVAHHRAKGTVATDFYALWPKWAVMARNYERRDRERDAQRTRGRAAIETPPAPYHANGARRLEVDLEAQLKARLAAEAAPEPEDAS